MNSYLDRSKNRYAVIKKTSLIHTLPNIGRIFFYFLNLNSHEAFITIRKYYFHKFISLKITLLFMLFVF